VAAKIYYKVVRSTGVLVSAIVTNRCMQIYKPGEWIEAEVGCLFIFKTLGQAIAWCGHSEVHEVWRCKAKNARPIKIIVAYWSAADRFRLFWKRRRKIDKDLRHKPPTGTYIADAVKLVEKIYPEK